VIFVRGGVVTSPRRGSTHAYRSAPRSSVPASHRPRTRVPADRSPLSIDAAGHATIRACPKAGRHQDHRNASRCSSTSATSGRCMASSRIAPRLFIGPPSGWNCVSSTEASCSSRACAHTITVKHLCCSSPLNSNQSEPDRPRMVRSSERDKLRGYHRPDRRMDSTTALGA
jgi:hypothetical protein